jgi:hypothetical protein
MKNRNCNIGALAVPHHMKAIKDTASGILELENVSVK